MDDTFHITIIGAGLGGLCLAQSLRHAGIRFDVFERDDALDQRAQGYRIRIDAAGQHALSRAWTPEMDSIFHLAVSQATPNARFLDTNLVPVNAQAPDSWQEDGGPHDVSIHRQTLRELLMTGIEDRVHFGQAFEHYESIDDDRLRVALGNETSIETDVLVGADGVNSRVRAQLAPMAAPTTTGAVCIYGKTTPSSRAGLPEGTHVILADGCAAILEDMRFRSDLPSIAQGHGCRLSHVDDYLYWALVGTRWRLGLPDDLSVDARPFLARIAMTWHPTLRDALCDGDGTGIAMLPIRLGRPDVAWPRGRVTLLGDAIHAMSPAGGRGANTALEDAASLAAALARTSGCRDLSSALESYDTAMRARGHEAIAVSQAGTERLSGV
ncbi:MAG: 5-methylphenazine-1-carboxylate 1-monooxygenase [Luteibacter sp.]|uniref:FAD-dependent oxidoreductase n=1 Tax=Luteibacter sp. TaxID=1886636 RepID=UPI00137D0A28|nr:NAD(P)/FAD-dependent oxidoreductase [Luteibacter sp.]KAF1006147.1 MAG: 5-methylphenazine-1-carboxylate 1-monooxygenase [Luteibacter sp.]